MSLPVHLVPSLSGVAVGGSVTVEGGEAHHAVAVRRLAVGESVVLTDGAGRSVVGAVASAGKRVFTVSVRQVSEVPAPSPIVTVVQAIPKGERGELAVEVLTEVGVSRIVPWAASRSVAVWRGERADKSLARWRSTAREAAKQSRRVWFPEVTPMMSTESVCELLGPGSVVLHEDASVPLSSLEPRGEVVVVVGPEGGVAPEEIAAFEAAGAVPVRLGSEVLRTSTAGLAAVSALLSRTPRWS